MKATLLRVLSLLVIIALLFSLFGCSSQDVRETDEYTEIYEKGDSSRSLALDKKYTIVCNSFYKSSSNITDALRLIKDAFEKSLGTEATYSTEIQGTDYTEAKPEYVIFLGPSEYGASKEALAPLGINDYTYKIVSENVVVICGGSTEATLLAAKKFSSDVLLFEDGNLLSGNTGANVFASYTYKYKYPYENLTINGIDIKDFKIAVEKTTELGYAEKFLSAFASFTGHKIPIVTFSELDGTEKGVLCYKAYSRDGLSHYEALADGGVMRFSEEAAGLTVGVDFTHQKYFHSVLEELTKKYTKAENGNSLEITLPESDIKLYNFDKYYEGLPAWELVDEVTEEVGDGVTYIERKYEGDNSLPYKTYILLVDPTKASLYMGSSNDGLSTVPTDKQSVVDHMKSAAAKGVDVIAGVNGDFFNIASDYSPLGLTIKEGKSLRVNPDRPFCAFTYDGRLIIGLSGALPENREEIRTSVGGSNVLIYDGIPYDIGAKTDFGDTWHPRTLAGVRADGTIILAVIDGRQPSLSNGASLGACARFMMELGAEYAINLDGGGSSTMVVKRGAFYNVKNSPSDGAPRKVFNSLIVVANK